MNLDAPSIVITGGGTAGHTNPGIAIGQALVRAGVPRSGVHFVGGERGNESQLVPDAGFSIDLLPGRGIRRSLAPAALRANAASVRALVKGLGRARAIIDERAPDAVVCLGGYASFAASVAAVRAGVPLVVSEQNARASAVNRLMSRRARVCALPYPDTDLPNGVLTGNPIRAEVVEAMANTDRAAARAALGLPLDRTVVAIWSGSLGARSVNAVAVDLARRLADRDDLAIHHVIGRRDFDSFASVAEELADRQIHYQSVAYEDRMPHLLVAADLAVTRAGASTTAELAVAGLPAVLVPLPGAPRDHQHANAQELVEVGGGWRVADDALSVDGVLAALGPCLDDRDARRLAAAAARSVGRPDAADAVARLVLAEAS